MTVPLSDPVPSQNEQDAVRATPRDCPVTDHQQEFCEHEMSQCAGGCPPYGYCSSSSHRGDVSPNWPCPTALRALHQTRAEWIAVYEPELTAWVERYEAEHPQRPSLTASSL